jgi:hypothetical protein
MRELLINVRFRRQELMDIHVFGFARPRFDCQEIAKGSPSAPWSPELLGQEVRLAPPE